MALIPIVIPGGEEDLQTPITGPSVLRGVTGTARVTWLASNQTVRLEAASQQTPSPPPCTAGDNSPPPTPDNGSASAASGGLR
ncbi:hypothetical protein NHX12_005809 [Muraenolepis orangiensis]|uniref:Uncharacterized protein n=1 Tax=Muraenolepis orangiensis TaxID=630683 RepID=A0A9Q0DRC2_9TELE|nr:hypothetical protein NHX12_005809 [Muraenolepis orangiensis]